MHLTKDDFQIADDDQSTEIPNSGGVRHSKLTPVGDMDNYLFEDAKTVAEALLRGKKMSGNGPCLGWRESEPEYKWLTYEEVIHRSRTLSYGLVRVGMKPGQDTFVGFYAQNCVEWDLMEHACYVQSVVPVPLYATLGPSACTFILNQVEAEIVVCDTEKKLRSILDVRGDVPKLRRVVMMQDVSQEVKSLATEKDIIIHMLKDIEDLGEKEPGTLMLPGPSDLATVCYTSGTTGNPKGVMLTHSNIMAEVYSFHVHLGPNSVGPSDRYLSFLPLAHVLERSGHAILLCAGASIGFFRGDAALIAEDFCVLKPTVMSAVPRVLNKIFDKVQSQVSSSTVKRFLLDIALRAKRAEVESGIIRNNSFWDHLVLRSIRNSVGGQVRLLMSAGAPIREQVLGFFRCSLGCPVIQAYGQTESTAAATCTPIGDCAAGVVGPPLPFCLAKLEDVPEMGYHASKGEGEILLKGPLLTKGYFKDPVRTAEILDEDGWLHTGDIGHWTESGSLAVIDRKKNILKLSQGEYVSPEKVESIYLGSPFVEQIFVDGNSLENSVVAVVVPDKAALRSWCADMGVKGEWTKICEDEQVKRFVLEHLCKLGKEAGLKGFEQVKAVHLHPDIFSLENGILTATLKVKRVECRRLFKGAIQAMYDSMQ